MNAPMDGEENIMDTSWLDTDHAHKAATQYTCVDKSLEQIPSSGGSIDGYLL